MNKLISVVKRDNGTVVIEVVVQGVQERIEFSEKDVAMLKQGIERVVRPGS